MMQPHPAVRSDGTLTPDRLLAIELTDREIGALLALLATHEVAVHDARRQHQDDPQLVAQLDAELALADRIHVTIDAGVRPTGRPGLPEADVVRLPIQREIAAHPH